MMRVVAHDFCGDYPGRGENVTRNQRAFGKPRGFPLNQESREKRVLTLQKFNFRIVKMKYSPRTLEREIRRGAKAFPALLLSGARRTGKTTLLRHVFPHATYVLLEEADLRARVRADPRGFLEALSPPVILDEIQNAPELLTYLRARIDAQPRRTGQWLLTGSQEAPLMKGVSDSMAGRVAVFTLLPFSLEERDDISLLTGGFPEVLARPRSADLWFRSYTQTYLERDVRQVTAIRDLATFRRFLGLLATRCGQMLNKTDLAGPLGVSVPTLTSWLGVLEITGQIILVPPYFENFGKRLVKSPKLYFVDSGLACSLLGIRSPSALRDSPFRGAMFESMVAAEILKHRLNRGLDRGLYWFRDRQGLEIDFLVEERGGSLLLIEVKAGQTVHPEDARNLLRLPVEGHRVRPRRFLVHQSDDLKPVSLAPGIKALGLRGLHESLAGG
jgi:uncharacterized protein